MATTMTMLTLLLVVAAAVVVVMLLLLPALVLVQQLLLLLPAPPLLPLVTTTTTTTATMMRVKNTGKKLPHRSTCRYGYKTKQTTPDSDRQQHMLCDIAEQALCHGVHGWQVLSFGLPDHDGFPRVPLAICRWK